MSDPRSLHSIVESLFREKFGEPSRIESHQHHWSLRSLGYIASINVLLDGSDSMPVVWVFDPHDPNDGVMHQRLKSEAEAIALADHIETRVRNAGRSK